MFPQLVLLGVAVNLLSTATYIRSTLKGLTQPNRMTFFMWSVAPLIAVAAGYADGVRWALVPVFMSGFAPFLNLLASYVNPKAYWKLGYFDYACGLFSILALVLWWLTKEPSIAVLFAIISDGFAAWPTILKAWRFPESEHYGAYAGSTFSALTAFAAITMFSFSAIAFPIYLILCNSLILLGIYRKKLHFRQ